MSRFGEVVRSYKTQKDTVFSIVKNNNSIGETIYKVIYENGYEYQFRIILFGLGDADSFVKDLMDSFNEGFNSN